jgi:hypothetical protein
MVLVTEKNSLENRKNNFVLIWIWHERGPDSFLNKAPAEATGSDAHRKTIYPGIHAVFERKDFPPTV